MTETNRTTSTELTAVHPKKNLILLFLMITFMLGMIYGVLLVSQTPQTMQQWHFLISEYSLKQQQQSIWNHFFSSFGSSLLFLVIPYLLGFSAIGQPLTLFIPLFKGLGLGAFLGNLYLSYGLKGIGYTILIVIPYTLVAFLAILIGCRESMRLSNLFFLSFAGKKTAYSVTRSVIQLYHIKFLVLCAMILLSSVIYTISVTLFSGLFQLSA